MESLILLTIEPEYLLYIAVIFLLIGVIVAFSVIYARRQSMSTPDNIARINAKQTEDYNTFLSAYYKPRISLSDFITRTPSISGVEPLSDDEKLLINVSPLTVTQPGYLGPLVDGVYNEKEGVADAIRAGARCFVLPIDYHENASLPSPQFALPEQPCLLVRDAGGNIRSLNSGSIQKIAETLSSVAFSQTVFTQNDPLIVVLYFIRTPDANKNPKQYLRFCSSVAKQLGPLIPNMLGQTSEGSYNRQAKQDSLFFSNLSQFEKKVLIFSNIDTSLFRTPEKAGLPAFQPKEDLDFLVHARIFKDTTAELGATEQMSNNQMPRAIVETVTYYTVIPEDRAKAVIDTTKIRWSLAIPAGPGTAAANLDVEKAQILANTYGVQAIPLLLSEKPGDVMNMWRDSAWRPKPKAIRFVNPKPFVPQQPSGKLNANQGQITSPH
jgi:hypothetical protein